jgi:hypothetical protein
VFTGDGLDRGEAFPAGLGDRQQAGLRSVGSFSLTSSPSRSNASTAAVIVQFVTVSTLAVGGRRLRRACAAERAWPNR